MFVRVIARESSDIFGGHSVYSATLTPRLIVENI